jgi:hypothetical protein
MYFLNPERVELSGKGYLIWLPVSQVKAFRGVD